MHLHHGSHDHAHDHRAARAQNSRLMWIALGINVALVAVTVLGAILTGSLALAADAGHLASDVLAISLGLAAARIAALPGSSRGTFGMGRVEIFAALINGLALVAVAAWITVAAIGNLSDPPELDAAGVLLLGIIGLAGNATATAVLLRGDRGDVNLEGVMRHSIADAMGSLGVVIAGAGILLTGWLYLDPIVALLVAVLILISSRRLLVEPLGVLMERAPAGLEVESIGRAIVAVDGVREVHDLHVWTITSGFRALAAHVTVAPGRDCEAARIEIERELDDGFGLSHTTLQMSNEQLVQIDPPRD